MKKKYEIIQLLDPAMIEIQNYKKSLQGLTDSHAQAAEIMERLVIIIEKLVNEDLDKLEKKHLH